MSPALGMLYRNLMSACYACNLRGEDGVTFCCLCVSRVPGGRTLRELAIAVHGILANDLPSAALSIRTVVLLLVSESLSFVRVCL